MSGKSAGSGVLGEKAWAEYCRRTQNAAKLVMAAAPDDPFDRAEGLRYVGRIAQHGLQSFIEESDPATPIVTHSLPKLGGDNPDYVYSVAALSGAYEYRLRGRLGDSSLSRDRDLSRRRRHGRGPAALGLYRREGSRGRHRRPLRDHARLREAAGRLAPDEARDLAAHDPRAAARPEASEDRRSSRSSGRAAAPSRARSTRRTTPFSWRAPAPTSRARSPSSSNGPATSRRGRTGSS